ncbi:MAG: hypothetical protein Q8N51_11715, partial [Gammaproteobacteria bacterium]|nr:hypothetical protein [Gammaproteobacteria bacterium]
RTPVTADNLNRAWPALLEQVNFRDLNLGIWFGLAKPTGLDGSTLLLEYPGEAGKAAAILRDPKNLQAMGEVLRAHTENLDAVRVAFRKPAGGASPAARTAPVPNDLPIYATVNPVDAREVLDDPGIAALVKTFRGRVADIRTLETPDA